MIAPSAYAHDGGAAADGLLTLDPLVLVPIALCVVLYWRGSLGIARDRFFAAGMAALAAALVYPLDQLGERLFSAHMAQHLVLMNIAAPLLVLSSPLAALMRGLPLPLRRALAGYANGRRWRAAWRWLCGAATATVLQLAALWIWHTPTAIARALQSEAIHALMHASLLAAALLFWTAMLRPAAGNYWAPIAALLITFKVTGLACIVLLLQTSGSGLYTTYGANAAAWGLTPEQDEQLGWGFMMIAGTLSYLGAAIALFRAALDRIERGQARLR